MLFCHCKHILITLLAIGDMEFFFNSYMYNPVDIYSQMICSHIRSIFLYKGTICYLNANIHIFNVVYINIHVDKVI